ncbi:hypothetical protein [Ruminococcus sp.]|uniref:hypothetical protein n=1 Tax=Ruminococcus sp. TaxID=41978 RepID=UPI0025F46AA1|nr:hypothetical protein [Ruminococcus sp.]
MAKRIKGITVEINGDTAKLSKALESPYGCRIDNGTAIIIEEEAGCIRQIDLVITAGIFIGKVNINFPKR